MVHNLYGLSIHFVLRIHISALPSVWLQKSKKIWKTAQAVESIVTSDSSTSCQLHTTCPCALHKDIPQKQLWGTPEHMVSQWNPDQPRGLCRAITVVSWNSTDSPDEHLRLCWLLPSPALLSVEQFQLTFRWISVSCIQIWDNNSSFIKAFFSCLRQKRAHIKLIHVNIATYHTWIVQAYMCELLR